MIFSVSALGYIYSMNMAYEDQKVSVTIDELAVMIAKGFAAVDKKFEVVDRRFEELESSFDSKIDGRFTEFETKMDARFNDLQRQLDYMYDSYTPRREFNMLEGRVKKVERKVGLKAAI